MCGIIGFNFDDKHLAKRMCDVIIHRGPDDEGYYSNDDITLGHRRLSIIDLKTGHQPIFNEDDSIVVIFNGEIYNFQELRNDLEKKGHKFKTATDTEIIVHAYEEFGYDCIKLFNGMFAFALYDSNNKALFLGRDRCGIKPLHYVFLDDGTFIFSSEIKSILQYKRIKAILEPVALHYLINLRYIPREYTMFKGIKRLLPAHYLIHHENKITIKKYWEPTISVEDRPEDYYVKTLKKLLDLSIRRHLVSDVPVGIFLSGGIDSSSIVALASQFVEEPLKTFCMGFGMVNDEIKDARYVADLFNTDHKELIVDKSLLKDYPKMIWFADEPKRNLYPFYIAEMVSKHVKTALGGLGGDELFGGYIFKYDFIKGIEEIRKKTMFETKRNISVFADKLISFQTRYGNIIDDEHLDYLETIRSINSNEELYLITQTQDKVFDKEYLERIYGEKLLRENLPAIRDLYNPYFRDARQFVEQVMLADFSIKLTDDFLLVDDRMTMANSLESRVPLLDKELVDFSFTIPVQYKTSDPNGKYIFKKAMKDILPKEVLKKEKRGFASGIYEPYLKEGRELAMQLLPEGRLVQQGYLKKDYINKILNSIPNPKLTLHYGVIWNMLMAEIWHGIYIDGDALRPTFNLEKIVY